MPIAPKRTVFRLAALGLIYFLLASLTIATTRLGNGVAILFVANAVLIAWLLTTPRREWRAPVMVCAFASTAATSLFGFGPLAAPLMAAVNMLEAISSVIAFRMIAGRASPLESLRGFFAFVLGMAIIGPAISGLGGASVASLYGADFLENAGRWVAGHGLGAMIFAPLSLLILRGDMGKWARDVSSRQRAEAITLIGGVAAVTVFTFTYAHGPLLFLPWLPVIVATFRLGRFGAAASIGLVTVIAGAATLFGAGPIVQFIDGREAELQFLQFYLAVTVLAVLPTAAELNSRKSLLAQVRSSEQRYRMLADYSTDIILEIDTAGRIIFASASIERLGGYRPGDLTGRPALDLVDPEDVEKVQAAHRAAISSPGAIETVEYRGITADGEQVWMETRTQGVFDADGKPLGAVSAIRNVEERKARERALTLEARTDGLTGALNRRAFVRELDRAAGSQRRAERGCLALFDIDHFKRVNDTLGHAAGDDVLIAFVRLARRIVRDGDVVGRIGGEEFAILLRGATFEDARRVCERLRLACAGEIVLPDLPGGVTVSAGIAALDGASAAQIMERADAALYRAKRGGRNRLELAA